MRALGSLTLLLAIAGSSAVLLQGRGQKRRRELRGARLLGVVSGSKNFDVRSWVRRAFWRQRPWRVGVAWRFWIARTPAPTDLNTLAIEARKSASTTSTSS